MAYLDRGGVEFFHWKIDGLPLGTEPVEAYLNGEWRALTKTGDTWSVLVAGPDAATVPAAVQILADQKNIPVRVTGTPEVVIRTTRNITLTN